MGVPAGKGRDHPRFSFTTLRQRRRWMVEEPGKRTWSRWRDSGIPRAMAGPFHTESFSEQNMVWWRWEQVREMLMRVVWGCGSVGEV